MCGQIGESEGGSWGYSREIRETSKENTRWETITTHSLLSEFRGGETTLEREQQRTSSRMLLEGM